jgi:hypothetical protein
VVDELHSAVRLVLLNSSRAWSSSGGVLVIERQVEVLRTVAGMSRLRHASSIHLLPSIRVIKDAAETAAHSLSPAIFGRETYMAEGPKIASAPSRNGVIAGPIKH